MAWIVKPSGTQQIERREQPYLTEQIKAHATAEILPRYPNKRAALLPVLHEVQHEHNWIPYQAIEEVAAFLELKPADVYDTATFYEEFFLQPKGKYLVQICQSISCELCGHEDLLQRMMEKYDIVPNEITEDDRFTIQIVECLGACDDAPAVAINGVLHKKMTWEQLEVVLEELPADPHDYPLPAVE
jgi:NADH-quinone oxidoreductase subunit E